MRVNITYKKYWLFGDIIIFLSLLFLSIWGIYHLIYTSYSDYPIVEIYVKGHLSYRIFPPVSSTLISLCGPLGETIVELDQYKVRILRDPGPKQICVMQGWIENPGNSLICAPNEIVILLTNRLLLYDTQSY